MLDNYKAIANSYRLRDQICIMFATAPPSVQDGYLIQIDILTQKIFDLWLEIDSSENK